MSTTTRSRSHTLRRSLGAIFVVSVFVFSQGCVSAAQLEEIEGERDELARERLQLDRQVSSLTQELEAKDRRIAELTGVSDRLSGELETEVAARYVDIQRLADGVRLSVSDQLLFPSGSAALDANGRALLGRIAGELDPDRQIISVVGHTDTYMLPERLRSKFATNWELAASRAAIVVRALSEAGIPPTALRLVSRGPFAPIASNDTSEGRAKNRRTEIIVRDDPRQK